MSSSLDLVGTNGGLAGKRFRLDPSTPLLIGRARSGLHVADPLVSLEHAVVDFADDRFWIRDLRSHTGTFVDGERLGEDAVPLEPGVELLFGETSFVVEEGDELPAYTLPLVGFFGFVVLVALGLGWLASRPVHYEPALTWSEPVRQGATTSRVVPVPHRFVRKHGRDHRGLSVRRVTDFDGDGVDEVWFGHGGVEWVITFAADGAWEMLGELPVGCVDREGLSFPDLACAGVSYRMGDDGYRIRAQDGVVAWFPPTKGAGAPTPFRVALIEREQLTGFLANRGVHEPIHYLVCEGAVPGVAAQVLTASGDVVRLDTGCIREMTVSGARREEIGREVPVAVAFTSAGHRALLDDVRRFLGGDVDGLFLGRAGHQRIAAMARRPELRDGSIRLAFEGAPLPGSEPVAAEGRVPEVARTLSVVDDGAAARPVTTATALTPGVFTLDPPGCSELEVRTRSWQCVLARWCTPGRTFLTVREVGCEGGGVVLEAPYGGGLVQGRAGDVEVRARIDSLGSRGRVDVLRSRVAFRTIAGD